MNNITQADVIGMQQNEEMFMFWPKEWQEWAQINFAEFTFAPLFNKRKLLWE
jgi:hypothetical protein